MIFIKKLAVFLFFVMLSFLAGCTSQEISPEIIESQSWIRYLGEDINGFAKDIVVIETGIYITGYTSGELEGNKSAGKSDIFLAKFNFNGISEWITQWGTEEKDRGNNIAVDSTGIYVAGNVEGSLNNYPYYGKRDLFISKYDFNGIQLWTSQLGTTGDDYTRGLSVNSSGIYITGATSGDLNGKNSEGKDDIFLIKFNTEGVLQWINQWGTKEYDWGTDVSVCDSGIYVTGFTKGNLLGNKNFGYNDIFLAKFNFEGNHQWTRQWGTDKNDEGSTIVSDSTGIYVAGRTTGPLDGNRKIGWDDIFLTKYDSLGKKYWTAQFGTKGSDKAYSTALKNDAIYVIGYTMGGIKNIDHLGASDIYLANYNLSGEKQWVKILGSRGFDYGTTLALKDMDIYITGDSSYGPGNIRNPDDNRVAFLQKLRFYQLLDSK